MRKEQAGVSGGPPFFWHLGSELFTVFLEGPCLPSGLLGAREEADGDGGQPRASPGGLLLSSEGP